MVKKVEKATDLKIEIGQRLRKIRTSNQFTQEDMANILDITSAYYGKIERGEYFLTSDKLLLLHKKLKIDINYLITGETHNSDTIKELLKRFNEDSREDVEVILTHLFNITNK